MSASVRTKHAFATGLAVVMTGGGLAAVAAPANAETGAVNYTCPVAGQNFQVSVNTDSTAPAKMYVGDTANLREALAIHPKAECFTRHKAECVGVHRQEDQTSGRETVADLVAELRPPCND